MSYYSGNKLYESIIQGGHNKFKFVSGNLWQLVYGNSNCEPKLLALVSGVSSERYHSQLNDEEQEAFSVLNSISDMTGIPLRVVKFNIDLDAVDEVITFKKGENPTQVSMSELKQFFFQDGIPVSNSPTKKYLNSASSSAFHNWQRESLGRDIKVSDFDLWKVNAFGDPIALYELKRSYYSLERWEPFRDDYNNFRLLFNVLRGTEVSFNIVYNVRSKNPWFDDVSLLKVFDVDFGQHTPIQTIGIISLKDFLS